MEANLGDFLFLGFAIVIAAVVALVLIFLGLALHNLVTRRPFWTDMRQWLAYPLIGILIILPVEGFYFFTARRGVSQHEAAKWLNIVFAAVFVFGYAIKSYWPFRKRWTFWLVLSVLAAAHVAALSRFPWQRTGMLFLIYVIGMPELAFVGFLLGLIFLRKPLGSEQSSPSEQSKS
jgi:hypothetical protein